MVREETFPEEEGCLRHKCSAQLGREALLFAAASRSISPQPCFKKWEVVLINVPSSFNGKVPLLKAVLAAMLGLQDHLIFVQAVLSSWGVTLF